MFRSLAKKRVGNNNKFGTLTLPWLSRGNDLVYSFILNERYTEREERIRGHKVLVKEAMTLY
jgi:hypothetical protein